MEHWRKYIERTFTLQSLEKANQGLRWEKKNLANHQGKPWRETKRTGIDNGKTIDFLCAHHQSVRKLENKGSIMEGQSNLKWVREGWAKEGDLHIKKY